MQVRARTRIARRLRRDATEGETRLWWALRDAFPGMRFRRQHPIGQFVVDFACPVYKLAIELDGGHHAIQSAEDQRRTEGLALRGYRVIRFWNHEVFENLPDILQVIEAQLVQTLVGQTKAKGGERRSSSVEAGAAE